MKPALNKRRFHIQEAIKKTKKKENLQRKNFILLVLLLLLSSAICINILIDASKVAAYRLDKMGTVDVPEVYPARPQKVKVVTKYLEAQSIEDKIRATFPENPDLAVKIAQCESGMNPKAFNGNNSNGSTDSGIMQINSVHGVSKQMLMDVDINLAVARVIYERAGNSFSPWVCSRKVK